MSAPITEKPCKPERAQLIDAVTKDAATYLGVDRAKDSPAHIVETINTTIVRIVFGEAHPIPKDEEPHLLLGCLWGEQMVREFSWSWADITVGNGGDVAVVSPARDMAIYPFTFVADCIAKRCICTVALSFNMLLERKGETLFSPQAYENVMLYVRHIVPPYTLEAKSE